jgi:D-sedoheptulose 7-phosphate isomerase
MQQIKDLIQSSIDVKQALLQDAQLLGTIKQVAQQMIDALKQDHRIWWCGNGGSAADAQHLAAELTGRFYKDREPLFSEALHVNTSYLTAVANDYSYDEIYSRLMKGKGRTGDILIGISTSGNSKNILRAFEVCKERGIITVGMTGATGGKMKELSDYLINVPSTDTPRIQESHILIGHILCLLVEEALF